MNLVSGLSPGGARTSAVADTNLGRPASWHDDRRDEQTGVEVEATASALSCSWSCYSRGSARWQLAGVGPWRTVPAA
eukprot:2679253-Prymnesium_polylepis.1